MVFTVAEISREIKSGGLSDNAVQKISVAIGKAVESGVANSRGAAPAAIRMYGAMLGTGNPCSTSLRLRLGLLPGLAGGTVGAGVGFSMARLAEKV